MEEEREEPQDPAAPEGQRDPESPGSWFFDPPGGAWQRQEAKNRELRDRVSENIEDSRRRRDVFRAPDADLIDQPERRGLFGKRRKKRDSEGGGWSSPGGTFALRKDAADQPARPPGEATPPPLKRWKPGEEPEHGWPAQDWEKETVASEEAPPATGERRTRFDEVFGGHVEGMNITESMRATWRKAPEEAPGPQSPPWREHRETHEPPPPADNDRFPAPDTRFEATPVEEPPATEQRPRTRWDEMFSGRAEGGMLEAMRKWSDTPPEPRQRRVLASEAATAEPVQRRPWETPDDDPEPSADAPEEPARERGGLFSKLGGMFRRKPEAPPVPEYEATASGRWTPPVEPRPAWTRESSTYFGSVAAEPLPAPAPPPPVPAAPAPLGPDPFAMAAPGPVEVVDDEWQTEESWQPEEPAAVEVPTAVLPAEKTPAPQFVAPSPHLEEALFGAEDTWQPDDQDEWPAAPAPLATVAQPAQDWHQAGGVPAPEQPAGDDVSFFEGVLEPAAELADVADGSEPTEAVAGLPEAEPAAPVPAYERTMPEPSAPSADDPWSDFLAARQSGLEATTPPARAGDGYEPDHPRRETHTSTFETPAPEVEAEVSQELAPAGDAESPAAATYEEVLGLSPSEPAPPPPIAGARGLFPRKPLSQRYEDPSRLRQEHREEFRPAAQQPTPAYDLDDEPGTGSPEDEMDLVLKAFERHAAQADHVTRPDQGLHAEAGVFDAIEELLGEDADDLIDQPEIPIERRPFTTLNRWAPQRDSSSLLEAATAWDSPPRAAEDNPESATSSRGWGSFDSVEAEETWPVERPSEGPPTAVPAAAAPARGHSKTRTMVRELVETGLLALLVFLAVRASFQNFKVDGDSMFPTLEDGEFLIVNKLVYSEVDIERLGEFVPFVDAGDDPERNVFHGPQRGDIVVFHDPRNPSVDLIKRIVGLPGETVEIVDGKVYINDHLLEEPYIKSEWRDNKPKVRLPGDEYFVMGDNRANSLDSRSIGLVHRDLVIGKALVTYWPRNHFGLAPNQRPHISDTEVSPNLAAAVGD